jgi:hypothetical protein
MNFLMNRSLFLTAIFALGVLVGAAGGAVAYYLAVLTMPWLTDSQKELVIPAFLLIGVLIGLFGVVTELLREKQTENNPGQTTDKS